MIKGKMATPNKSIIAFFWTWIENLIRSI